MEKDAPISNKILKVILTITVVASLIITFLINNGLEEYRKYISMPFIIILLSYTLVANITINKVNNKAYIYLAYIMLILNSNLLIPLAPVNKILNIIVVPILTSVYIFSLINPNYKISINFYRWFFKLIPGYLFSNLEYVEETLKSTELNNKKTKDILKGILITIPILVILVILLTSADQYFSSFIGKILLSFKFNLSISKIYRKIITLVFSFIFIFSTSINIYQNKDNKEFETKKQNISNTISYILLSVINAVYLLFLISEISKLTINFLNIPVEYTYAKYAREGFFQLLAVSSINFAIILFYQYFVKDIKDNKLIKYMLLSIIAFSIFIIFNSYYRMGLYIFEYGFTILRLQVILFLTMELLFFIILIFKLNNKLKKDKSLKYLIIMLITYFLNIYLCNEIVINFINELWFKYVLK